MATLADLNKTLQEQNNLLDSVNKNTENTQDGISTLADKLGLTLSRREEEYERNKKKQPSEGGFGLPSLGLAGTLGFGLRDLAANSGFMGSLIGGLMKVGKGGLLLLAGTYLADAVGDYIESGGGDAELAQAARRAIQVGSIAGLFGIKFGLIGAAVGAVLNEESIAKIKEIGEQVAGKLPFLGTLFEDLGIYVPTLSDVTKTVNDALDGVIGLMEGDMTKFAESMGEIAQLIGVPLALLGKGKVRALGITLTGLGTAMDYMGEQLGPVGEALTGAVGGLLGAAYLMRNKIKDFLKRNNLPDDVGNDKKPNTKPKPVTPPTPIEEVGPDGTKRYRDPSTGRYTKPPSIPTPKGKTGIGSVLDDILKGGGKVAKIAGKGVLRFIPGLGFALLAADVAEAAGVPVYDSIGSFFKNAFGADDRPEPAYDDAILRQLRGMNADNPTVIKEMLRPLPTSSGMLDEFSDQYGPAGALNQPGAGTVLAPQVDASTTSIDQSQSALITADQHVGSTNPFAISYN